jgi:hypothetical protein
MPKSRSKTPPSPITERVQSLCLQIAEARGEQRRLTNLLPELKTLAEDARAYFAEREKTLSRLEPKGASRLQALEIEVEKLASKQSKTDEEYLRLAGLERKLVDERRGCEQEVQNLSDADALLNEEIATVENPMTVVLEALSPHRRELLSRIINSLAPWYPGDWASRVPQLAASTPVYQESGKLYHSFFKRARSAQANAKDLVAAIDHALSQEGA